jgi:hypothetical protein
VSQDQAWQALQAEIVDLEAKGEPTVRAALLFYADQSNWEEGATKIIQDGGARARDALMTVGVG